jgi:hypothetical protein
VFKVNLGLTAASAGVDTHTAQLIDSAIDDLDRLVNDVRLAAFDAYLSDPPAETDR